MLNRLGFASDTNMSFPIVSSSNYSTMHVVILILLFRHANSTQLQNGAENACLFQYVDAMEPDIPNITSSLMYEQIATRKSVPQLYKEKLIVSLLCLPPVIGHLD